MLELPGGVRGRSWRRTFSNSKNIALTDSYGCTHDITFDYDVFELPDLGVGASFVCEGENVDVEVNGADVYTYAFDPQASVLTTPAIFAPGAAVTGDSIQQLELLMPDSGDVLVVTGLLVHVLNDSSELECSASEELPVVVYPSRSSRQVWILKRLTARQTL